MKMRLNRAELYILDWVETGLGYFPEWVADGVEKPRPDGRVHLPDLTIEGSSVYVPADGQLVKIMLHQVDLAEDSISEYDEDENPEADALEGTTVSKACEGLRRKLRPLAARLGLGV